MRELIAITDVTHMWGDQVCIAGVNKDLKCIRPVIENGVLIWDLLRPRKPVIFPGAKVEFDLTPADIVPPHIEDATFDPDTVKSRGTFGERHWEQLLRSICFKSVSEIFDGHLENRNVPPGTNTRSLGTVADVRLNRLEIDDRFERRTLRMDFEDATGEAYKRFPVNDLAFRGFFQEHESGALAKGQAELAVMAALTAAARVYLRVGLARPTGMGDYEEACWAQITGVYTFPDYLNGRTFADFDW